MNLTELGSTLLISTPLHFPVGGHIGIVRVLYQRYKQAGVRPINRPEVKLEVTVNRRRYLIVATEERLRYYRIEEAAE